MIFTTGRVRKGAIEIEPQSLPEGAKVTVLALEGDEAFELSAEQRTELRAAIAELERGEGEDASDLLKGLPAR